MSLNFINLSTTFAFMPKPVKIPAATHQSLLGNSFQSRINLFPSVDINYSPDETSGFIESVSSSAIHPSLFDGMSQLLTAEETGYSSLSLYFTLALYVLTLPGLYSLVTRSVKAKATERVYDLPGPANPTAKTPRQIAGEVMAYFKALNYEVTAAEDVIYFRGVMGRSNSQAAFLTFCTFVGLGSLALVLSILLPDVGAKAYAITLLSPYAGIYYWNNAQREDKVAIKMETSDDEQLTTLVAQGGKEDLERFSKSLGLPERGKVYVKGLFELENDPATIASSSVATIPVAPASFEANAQPSSVDTTRDENKSVDAVDSNSSA